MSLDQNTIQDINYMTMQEQQQAFQTPTIWTAHPGHTKRKRLGDELTKQVYNYSNAHSYWQLFILWIIIPITNCPYHTYTLALQAATWRQITAADEALEDLRLQYQAQIIWSSDLTQFSEFTLELQGTTERAANFTSILADRGYPSIWHIPK